MLNKPSQPVGSFLTFNAGDDAIEAKLYNKVQSDNVLGDQAWHSGEGTYLQPMCPRFDSSYM